MATMYETIMNLPLFKGLSHEQVSAFLELFLAEFHSAHIPDSICLESAGGIHAE